MLVGCIITYNDFPLVKECVDSIIGIVDRLIIVDGKYRDYPGEDLCSTGDTLKYLKELKGAEVIYAAGLTEVEKRNVYLEELKDGDICLNLDADEALVGKFTKLDSDFGIVELYDRKNHKQDRATRLFRFRKGMEYRNVHYTLYYDDRQINSLKKVINPQFSFEHIKDFYLVHNWHKRSQLRQHEKSIYYKRLIRMEAGFPR
jgi:hypothetical protein